MPTTAAVMATVTTAYSIDTNEKNRKEDKKRIKEKEASDAALRVSEAKDVMKTKKSQYERSRASQQVGASRGRLSTILSQSEKLG
jgi:hypothetical protein